MRPQRSLILVLALSLPLACAARGVATESTRREEPCHTYLPSTLLAELDRQMPGFRVDDDAFKTHAWDMIYTLCMTVVSEDFDGDGRPDFAFLADSPKGNAVIVAAMQTSPDHWTFEQLFDFGPKPVGNFTIGKLEPGQAKSFGISVSHPAKWSLLSGIVMGRYVFSEYGDKGWVSREVDLNADGG